MKESSTPEGPAPDADWQPPSGPTWVVVFVALTVALVAGAYVYRFGAHGLSAQTSTWGEFGDYIGGVLNPIVALAALGLLAYSVTIQKRELRAAHRALASQAAHAEDMVWLSANVAVVEYIERRMALLHEERTNLPVGGLTQFNTLVVERRQEIDEELPALIAERDMLLTKVKSMVAQSHAQELRRSLKHLGV